MHRRIFLPALAAAWLLLSCSRRTSEPYIRLAGRSPVVANLPAARARLLVFWATWCPSCREETSELTDLARSTPAGMAVVVISEDEDGSAIRAFFGGEPPAELHLRQDARGALAAQFGVGTLPVSFLEIEGELRARFDGPRQWHSRMRPTLERLLAR